MNINLIQQQKLNTFKIFKASSSDIKWVQDPLGYFLIRPNRKDCNIEVAFVNTSHELMFQVSGKTPEMIYSKLVSMALKLRPEHWAYLGKELEKVFISMDRGIDYVQDSPLDFSKKPIKKF